MANGPKPAQGSGGAEGAGIDPRLAKSAALRVFVVFRRLVNPALMMEIRSEHLHWMLENERSGVLFMSGPLSRDSGDAPYNGLTMIRAESIENARSIIEDEPFIARGVMTYDLAEWTIYEGALPVTMLISESSAKFS